MQITAITVMKTIVEVNEKFETVARIFATLVIVRTRRAQTNAQKQCTKHDYIVSGAREFGSVLL